MTTGTHDEALRWIKSSYSGGSSTECVEAAVTAGRSVNVRDSKRPADGQLTVGAAGWGAFLDGLRGA